MDKYSKSCLILTSLLLMSIPLSSANPVNSVNGGELESQVDDGLWVNDTLTINGTTTIPPADNANWILYDVTDPYVSWNVLRSGEYFSEVVPVEEGLWSWSITIDTQGLGCTCWLEISQTDGMGKEFLNRIIFIGEGPHAPILSQMHDLSVIVDEPVQLSAKAIVADSNISDSRVIMNWCHAPNGACEGETHTSEIDVTWESELENSVGSFLIDATELELFDGLWKFSYFLQDNFLRLSPQVNVNVYVDQTDPEALLICPEQADEGSSILIDGSGSKDGVWGNNLQSIWYITNPDGGIRVANSSETNDMVLNLIPIQSGSYTVRLDVIDSVGRMSSTTAIILVENVIPTVELEMADTNVTSPNSWQLIEGEKLELFAQIDETENDMSTLNYEWYLNDTLVSNSPNYTIDGLEEAVYELRFVVIDDDLAEDTHEMYLIVSAKPDDSTQEINITAIIMIVGIIAFSVLMFRRMRVSENESSVMPKWESSKSKNLQESNSQFAKGSELWDDSSDVLEGKN